MPLSSQTTLHHFDTICSKAASRLHFLQLLTLPGASLEDLVCLYTKVVRPILEYASRPDTQASLWLRRTPRVNSETSDAPYVPSGQQDGVCIIVGIDDLHSRHEHLTLPYFNHYRSNGRGKYPQSTFLLITFLLFL